MKQSHIEALEKLDAVITELSKLCEEDNSFNKLLGELNQKQNIFGKSLDEYDIFSLLNKNKL
ncbi:hypothetical protein [Bacillus cihuensis]|uniref:hypothetical protein n=1 Tax=Bacillus cihuensis TaxID=1208599 RepID=UPI00040A03E4|nr:hypothetical protein [Bacillus cihuensis]